MHLNILWLRQCFLLPYYGNYFFILTSLWLSIKRDIKWYNRYNLALGQQKPMNCWRFIFNSSFYRSSKSAERKYYTKLSFCNLGKATPLIIFLRVKKPSRCGCHTIYILNLCLDKTWMQQQKNSGLFHTAKWNLCILVYNSIFIVLFLRRLPSLFFFSPFSLFSFFPVCLWLLLGWCHSHSLHTGRPNLHLRNTKKLVQLLSHSRLTSDSMLEAQTLHKLPVKANLPN